MTFRKSDFKIFVREQGSVEELPRAKKDVQLNTGLRGEEAQSFYQEVVSSEPTSAPSQCPSGKMKIKERTSKKENLSKRSQSLFKLAQDNDVDGLKELIESGTDVNLTDSYGWTALMCAACSGSESTVAYLLKAGADEAISDKAGYSATFLAMKNGHTNVVDMLKKRWSLNQPRNSRNALEDKEQFCTLCMEKFHGGKNKHEASTTHLLKRNSVKNRTFYGIPESNKGFQLLMQQGWNRERGLGRGGFGRKFPIKVKVKPDRSGIGVDEKKNRCVDATFKLRSSSKRDERRLERNFRREFL